MFVPGFRRWGPHQQIGKGSQALLFGKVLPEDCLFNWEELQVMIQKHTVQFKKKQEEGIPINVEKEPMA